MTTAISEHQSTGDTKDLQDRFEQDGFVCITQAIPLDQISIWHQFSLHYFEECFQKLHQAGHTQFPCHAIETSGGGRQYALQPGVKGGFREIVMRSPGRYEMSLLHCPPEQVPAIDAIQRCLHPLIPNILGENDWKDVALCHLSLLVSTPGSPEQTWHSDGGHNSLTEHLPCHVANVFIPLQNVPVDLGPTEFRPGSHVYTRNLARMMLAARARKQLRAPVVSELTVGDVLIFDYRVLHRGMANKSDSNRPILVLTFSKPWYKDVCNFPKRSMLEGSSPEEEAESD